MIKIGQEFPKFHLKSVVSNNIEDAFQIINNETNKKKWKIFFFWPKDFTFICPTEILEFNKLNQKFEKNNSVIYGVSNDSEFVHLAWRRSNKQLSNIKFPMLSDIKKELSNKLNIIDDVEGICLRATYIVDPENKIRFININDLSVGRNPQEVLRNLQALQTEKLCGCNWEIGDKNINIE